MKKIASIFIVSLISIVPTAVFAQGMMMYPSTSTAASSDQTTQDEAAGKAVFDKLQAKQVECKALSDEDFDVLGDYFMGQMMGDSHAGMNVRMEQSLGSDGEKQMHVVMGKRLSGCDPAAAYPASGTAFMSMMMGSGTHMMNWGYRGYGMSYGWSHSPFMILGWILMIIIVIALVKWLMHHRGRRQDTNSALDILKERYAKSEITKQEFEEKKGIL